MMNAIKDTSSPTNVLVVGVGGQGVIMISKVLARICQIQGLQVKQSEVHGMAKRGGVVFSHVRFGQQVWSPTITKGEADILLALEWAEGLRWLSHLKRDSGTFISDTQHIVPPFSCRNRRRGGTTLYAQETPSEVLDIVGSGFALDATRMALELGNERVANTILLGALSTALEFPLDDWLSVLAESVPPKTVEVNREAFLDGRRWVETFDDRPPATTAPPPEVTQSRVADDVRLEIVEAWCKGCDICVKMCPERCLVLNAKQIVELPDPQACTGCRLCEWLCPDFAIAVHVGAAEAVSNV
jgi:indolepyruvate ferredoxin oxidoreductase, beta subunit